MYFTDNCFNDLNIPYGRIPKLIISLYFETRQNRPSLLSCSYCGPMCSGIGVTNTSPLGTSTHDKSPCGGGAGASH